MQNILVALDGSKEAESVLPYVAAIAKGFGSHVTLVNSIYHPMSGIFGEEPADWQHIEEIESAAVNWAKEYLQNKTGELEALDIKVSWYVLHGNPSNAILDYANEIGPDLIAMSTHGRSGIRRVILGSVTQRILHSCKCPLLLIHPSHEEQEALARLTEIVVPLDTSDLAGAALPLSRSMANRLGLKLSLVTAIPTEADLYLGIEYMVHPADLVEQAEQAASSYLADVAQKIREEDGSEVGWEVLHGDAGSSIVDYAKERPDNLVAMSTHGRSGLGRWVLGSVTDKVVRSSGDPVIVVRPSNEQEG